MLLSQRANDQLPESLSVLFEGGYCKIKNPKLDQYIYISGLTTTDDPDQVVAYEDPNQIRRDGKVSVLFLDTHVERLRESKY